MRVACPGCGKQLAIADDKVPDRAFALTCPGCKTRIPVDPATHVDADAEATPAAARTAPSPATEPSSSAEGDGFGRLPALRATDQALLDRLAPEAWVVDAGGGRGERLEAALRQLGMDEVRHFDDLAEAAGALGENDVGVLVVSCAKVEAPPCAPLRPLHILGPDVRRRVFVAMVGDNVRSLDGQVAFLLQVNCLIAAQDLAKLPRLLQRALLHHQRLYRHWADAHQVAT